MFVVNGDLARIWGVLNRFCDLVNGISGGRRELSQSIVLQTMASTVYRLLELPVACDSTDEIIRLATLSFCASIFLHWRQVRIPFDALQRQFKHVIARSMHSHTAILNPRMILWILMIYGVTFSPLPAEQREELQLWLTESITLCELATWNDVSRTMTSFLWIDMVCDHPARSILDETFSQHARATSIVDAHKTDV